MQVAAAASVVSEIHKVGGMVERAMGRVDEVENMVFKVGGKIEDVLLATKVCTPSLPHSTAIHRLAVTTIAAT